MDLDAALTLLASNPDAPLDVAELALHLARDEYPELDVEAYLGELDGMAREASNYVRGDLAARAAGLCRYLFHEMGFRGNIKDYYDPRNSYFSDVLDRRTGIPITLSVLAIAVAARVGFAVEGVGLPGHYIARAVEGDREELFDPFHGGRRLTRDDCATLVLQVTGQEFEATPATMRPMPLAMTVARMLTNLKLVYLREGDFVRGVRVMQRLVTLSPYDAVQRRDLGTSLLRIGHPGRAVDQLSVYLEAVPHADDADTVRGLLSRARRQLADWN